MNDEVMDTVVMTNSVIGEVVSRETGEVVGMMALGEMTMQGNWRDHVTIVIAGLACVVASADAVVARGDVPAPVRNSLSGLSSEMNRAIAVISHQCSVEPDMVNRMVRFMAKQLEDQP